MTKYKYILFDWDGCLAKTLEVWLESYKRALKELNIHKSDKEIAAVFGDWHGGTKLGAHDNDKFFEKVDESAKENVVAVDLAKGAKECLTKLKADGFVLAILTNTLKDFLIPALKNHGIENLFETKITGEEVEMQKPDPEIINKAINKLGGSKSEYLIVGDSDKDIEASKNAGIDSLLYYPSQHSLYYDFNTLMETKPTLLARSFKDIYKILNSTV